jgi:hypothetical protein
VSLAAIREGLQFVVRRQAVLGAMTLDMFAVIFGGATALLPIVAKDILGVGGLGYGLLYAALDIGALATAVSLFRSFSFPRSIVPAGHCWPRSRCSASRRLCSGCLGTSTCRSRRTR